VFKGIRDMAIGSIKTRPIDSLWAPISQDEDVTFAWCGDSYSQVQGLDTISTMPQMVGSYLGWRCVDQSVQGGTGYDQPPTATTVSNFVARAARLATSGAAFLIVEGGHNAASNTTPAQQAACQAFIDAATATGFPAKRIIILGALRQGTSWDSFYAPHDAGLLAAATSRGADLRPDGGLDHGHGVRHRDHRRRERRRPGQERRHPPERQRRRIPVTANSAGHPSRRQRRLLRGQPPCLEILESPWSVRREWAVADRETDRHRDVDQPSRG
jgi:hypothetical protein